MISLEPEKWFERGRGILGGEKMQMEYGYQRRLERSGYFAPPPAAADIVVDEMKVSRHKHTDAYHVFISPQLIYFTRRKKLQK